MSHLTSDITIEQIDEWFKVGVPPPKAPIIPRSKLQGHYLDPQTGDAVKTRESSYVPHYKRNPRENNPSQTEYAQKYEEEERMRELSLVTEDDLGLPDVTRKRGGLSDLDFASTSDAYEALGFPGDKPQELAADVYKHYRFDHTYSESLPITEFQEQIINTIESNQVTVIQGSTGSGKTTQVPQYILDHYAKDSRYCNIVVTQPRRIAAISIAKRVSDERGWQLGSLVGYQVAMDRCTSDDTRLCYVTTGVLLQKLINVKNMNHFTHVILDEVHERDQDSDFCLLVTRKLLRSTSRQVKIILMSATIDSDMFAHYFSLPVRGRLESAPVVNVEGKAYDVTEYYVEDFHRLGQMPFLERDNPSVSHEARELARQLILQFDRQELQEQEERVDDFPANRGTVLVFLPGIVEINDMFQALNNDVLPYRLWVLPLHSSITTEEQSKAFVKAEKGRRKVILATNIAESSITVPDIKYVIDFMLIKCLICDPETNYQSLQLNWASKANATQRKGRAGRVSSGKVYRMVTRDFWDKNIQEYGIPEMARCPLEHLVLQVKLLDLGEPKAILGLALTPPNLDDIERTILLLKEVGALSTVTSGVINPHDGDLTFVGRVLASLPVDIKVGKLLVLGHVFGCLESALIIGASLSLQSFFAHPFRAYLDAYRSKMAWADWSFSDLIAILNAYRTWEQCLINGEFRRTGQAEIQWGRKNMIQIKRIKMVAELIQELRDRLAKHNIRVPRGPNIGRDRPGIDPAQDTLILKLVLCGAFYPNYFVCGPSDEADALKTLSGKDPFTTVMIKGIPPLGHLYKTQIAGMFRQCGKGNRLYFEDTRCYVEFEKPRTTDDQPLGNNILPAVYLAVKMRHLRMRMELQLTEVSPADQKLLSKDNLFHENKLKTNRFGVMCDDSAGNSNKIKMITEDGDGPRQVALPAPGNNWVDIFVTEVVEANRFWAHYGDFETFDKLRNLMESINQYDGYNLKPISKELQRGQFCLAPYEDDAEKYYRARVESLKGTAVEVFYIDYGNVGIVEKRKIREITADLLKLPFQAFECVLQGIKPFYRLPDGRWMPQARETLIQVVSNKIMFAKIYSIVRNTLRIDLIDTTQDPQLNINDLLIKMEFAERADEPYTSKLNHEQREEADIRTNVDEHLVEIPQETVMRVLEQGRKKGRAFLHGPFSPYEMNFYPMTQVGSYRATRIEPNSVNSVALSEEPQDKHDRMMVAALVSVNSSGSALVARDTTLMPNIHGLPALVSMLFSPTMELRTDPLKTRYTGALCGLGWDPDTNGPALPDHDMEITFDVNITTDDITMINGVRMAINLAVGSEDAIADWGPAAIFKIQKSARDKLLRLIMKRRESVIPYSFDRPYRWNLVSPEDVLPHGLENTTADCPVLYQLHDGIAVSGHIEVADDSEEKRQKMIAHIKDLRNKAGRSMVTDPIVCQVCQVLCQTPRDLLLHLETRAHQSEERLLYHPE